VSEKRPNFASGFIASTLLRSSQNRQKAVPLRLRRPERAIGAIAIELCLWCPVSKIPINPEQKQQGH
jgi:hypothetical protein